VKAADEAAHDSARPSALDPSVVRRWVERTCAAQGVPVVVTDAVVLAKVATLLGAPGHGRDASLRVVA
jgi:hypothetical protein